MNNSKTRRRSFTNSAVNVNKIVADNVMKKQQDGKSSLRRRSSSFAMNQNDNAKVHREGAKQRESTLGFNIHVLTQLKIAFDKADADGSGALDEQEFVSAFKSVKELSQNATDEQIQHLFMKIDANSDGTVDWDEFTNHMLLEQGRKLAEDDGTLDGTELYAERIVDTDSPKKGWGSSSSSPTKTPRRTLPASTSSSPLASPGSVHSPAARRPGLGSSYGNATMHLKLERIQREREKNMEQDQHGEMLERITHVPEIGLFLTAGRDGYIRQWSDETLQPERKFRCSHAWLTDMSYVRIGGARSLAVASMDRSITFYDVNTSSMEVSGRLHNLDGAPMCLTWLVDRDREMLMFGDDTGVMHSYRIGQQFGGVGSGTKLGASKIGGAGARQAFGSMSDRTGGFEPQQSHRIHTDWITKLQYQHHTSSLLSCSMDSTLKLTDIERRKAKWTVSQHVRGVYGFDTCQTYNFIVSCGLERNILLWNPFTGKSVGSLTGHTASVIDVIVNERDNQMLSLSMDKCVKIWDIRSNKCLQTIIDNSVHWPENKLNCMCYDDKRNAIVVGGSRLVSWQRVERTEETVHLSTCALFNPQFRQVVLCDEASGVTVYSAERGLPVFSFHQAHGDEKICAMTFDSSGRRLITGAQDGSLRMWNFNNGQCLKVFEGFGDQELSCIAFIEEGPNRFVAAAGWNREVCIWNCTSDTFQEDVQRRMEGHKDDILCMVCCSNVPGGISLLATGGYDGLVILWKLDGVVRSILTPPSHSKKDIDDRSIVSLVWLEKLAGTLVACSVDGMVHFWNVSDGALLYEIDSNINANAVPGSTIMSQPPTLNLSTMPSSGEPGFKVHTIALTCACANTHNTMLFVADSNGYVKRFDIQTLDILSSDVGEAVGSLGGGSGAMGLGGVMGSVANNVIADEHTSWRAHSTPIVSVDMAEHQDNHILMSASKGGATVFWTCEGRRIGTFDANSTWNLDEPLTWLGKEDDSVISSEGREQSSLVAFIESRKDLRSRERKRSLGDNLDVKGRSSSLQRPTHDEEVIEEIEEEYDEENGEDRSASPRTPLQTRTSPSGKLASSAMASPTDNDAARRNLTSSERRVNVRKINDIIVAVANSLQSRRQLQRKKNAVVIGSMSMDRKLPIQKLANVASYKPKKVSFAGAGSVTAATASTADDGGNETNTNEGGIGGGGASSSGGGGGSGVNSVGVGGTSSSASGAKTSKLGKSNKTSRLFGGASSRHHGSGGGGNDGDEVDEDVGSSAPSSSFTDMVNFSLKYANAYFASMAGGGHASARASYGSSGDTVTGHGGGGGDDDSGKSHRPPKLVRKVIRPNRIRSPGGV